MLVERFRDNVRHLLDGQAKAMVVTGSRQEAVRYHLVAEKYIGETGHDDVQPLVAFSGSVPADEYIPVEVTETSSHLNPGLRGRGHREAFDTDDYNVMIVANKFQTGFDEPRQCAMYVDRKLRDVDCVQTLSRLNRVFPGKPNPFVLGFVNDGDDVRAAFEPCYNTAELTDVFDPNVVYDLLRKLNDARICEWHEVESFARAFFDPKAKRSKLSYWVDPARQRFKTRYEVAIERIRQWRAEKRRAEEIGDRAGVQRAEHELSEAGEERDALETFRKDLQSFVWTYEFLSRVIDFNDRELEQLCVFARHPHPLPRTARLEDDTLDVSDLQLTHYRLTKRHEREIRRGEEDGDYTLDPASSAI